MCGIAGAIHTRLSADRLEKVLIGFQRDLQHRGPDDRGAFVSQDATAGLVNTRLAILDLSPAGHQPMSSADGRFHIVFNGEIYNFKTLRQELEAEGEKFESNGDTEVVLRMFMRYGRECVRELSGMFAFAIWDDVERSCFVARGPLGIKPLYYHEADGRLLFASELRAIIRSGLVPRQLASDAVAGYLLFGAVPEPLTLIDGVRTLPAGHTLVWRDGRTRLAKYWDLRFGQDSFTREAGAACVREALQDSVRRHLVSDVPIGVFLSGGLDSSAIVALAAKEAGTRLRTFCISFDDPDFNEGDVAQRTAKHFGAEHRDWRLDPETARGLLEQFMAKSDQPSIDGFNTFCVAKLAHDAGLKVVLSGLGGDELFGGYQSFDTVPKMVRASRLATPLGLVRNALGQTLSQQNASPRVSRLGHFLAGAPITSMAYWAMRGIFTPAEVRRLLPQYSCRTRSGRPALALHVPPQPTLEDEVSYLEITRYMRNQLLRDSDVMSMAWSLELRVPFVDSRVVEAIENIPAELRLARGKRILLDAVPEIPLWVRQRPKQGFVFPFKDWISGDWEDVFRRIEASSPVRLKSWYRRWCLFALENFIQQNAIEAGGES